MKYKVGDIVTVKENREFFDQFPWRRSLELNSLEWTIKSISSMGLYRCESCIEKYKYGFLEIELILSQSTLRNNKLNDLGI